MKHNKCDYLKGIMAGLALQKKLPARYVETAYAVTQLYYLEIEAAMRKVSDKYQETLPQVVDGNWGSLANQSQPHIRAGYFKQGLRDALEYGQAQTFAVFHYVGTGHYNASKLADRTIFIDPSVACMRSWELDPQGHKFTSMALHYAHGAAEGLNE